MTVTYFASAGVLYAQEGGRCAMLTTRSTDTGFEDRWVAVPVPDMAALFPTREGRLTVTTDKAPYLGRDVCSACGDIPDDVSPTQHMRNVHGLEPDEFDIS